MHYYNQWTVSQASRTVYVLTLFIIHCFISLFVIFCMSFTVHDAFCHRDY